MKKMIALALLALGVASLVGCRHHHRPDHDHPDYRRDNRAVPPPPPKPGPRPRSHRP